MEADLCGWEAGVVTESGVWGGGPVGMGGGLRDGKWRVGSRACVDGRRPS